MTVDLETNEQKIFEYSTQTTMTEGALVFSNDYLWTYSNVPEVILHGTLIQLDIGIKDFILNLTSPYDVSGHELFIFFSEGTY